MSEQMYKKLKRQNGEKFAQALRNHHNGLLEIPDLDLILRHAGRDAEPLLPHLMSLIAPDDNAPPPETLDPFILLDHAGYDAFHADTLEKQNSIKRYFKHGELLCTFNDSSRYKNYHIIHAVKKDADEIHRGDFNGKEKRQDAYGTSVISIQILKKGGFISIKNRYNHVVTGADNTFNSNPDNIIDGLSTALKRHFNVDFSIPKKDLLAEGFILMDGKIFKYNEEQNTVYYGDQALANHGQIRTIDRSSGDALFDGFLFDNKTKMLKKIDPGYRDSFASDFNQFYGGNPALHVRNGNLMLNDDVLIGAEESKIKTLYLPAFTKMRNYCLFNRRHLTHFNAPNLTTMGKGCLKYAPSLTHFDAPALKTTKGKKCLHITPALEQVNAPRLGNFLTRVRPQNIPAVP